MKQTVSGRLEQMLEDLTKLTTTLQNAKQFKAAAEVANVAAGLDHVIETNQIPSNARWPPRVVTAEGGKRWECG